MSARVWCGRCGADVREDEVCSCERGRSNLERAVEIAARAARDASPREMARGLRLGAWMTRKVEVEA